MKGYSTLHRAPELEPHHQVQFSVISRILFREEDLIPYQRMQSAYSKPY